MADEEKRTVLHSREDAVELLRSSRQPVFYISRTATNLLGVERFVPGLQFITLVDSWDGTHPSVFVPPRLPRVPPGGNVQVVNWLLRDASVQAHIARRTPDNLRPQIVLAFFDAESERLCARLGYELIMPADALRTRLDSKIVTTQLGDSAGVASVPNILTRADSWDELRRHAETAGLGADLVVQTPYGNSGQTTYFMSSAADYARVAAEVSGSELKVMRRINHRAIAVDAMLTRGGTVVGPFLTEVTGHPELTRYRGGWAGNELTAAALDDTARGEATELVQRLGARLGAEGYRGAFGVDLLLDTDTGAVYLGELNPRLSGALSLSNLPLGPFTELPLFAYHVLEYAGVELAPDALPPADAEHTAGEWSHVIIQHTSSTAERIVLAPQTGRYRVGAGGGLTFVAAEHDWHHLEQEDEVFYLRVLGAGEYRTRGVDLGVLVMRHRVQDSDGALTTRAQQIIAALQREYAAVPLSPLRNFLRRGSLAVRAVSDRLRGR